MEAKIIFSIPFTGKTPHGDGFRGQNWYEHRLKIFKEYTLKSLMNQTDKNFLLWLQFRPQEKDNIITKLIEDAIKESRLEYVITFNGPIIMEDKAIWHNEDLIKRAKKSLKKLKGIKENYVIEVGLDSDDMVINTFVEFVKGKEYKEAFYMRGGFILSTEDRLSQWYNPNSMSIYTINYPTKIFLNAKKHFEFQKGFNSHEQIPDKFNAELLPDGMFCSVTHGQNISTVWEHPFREQEIYNELTKRKIINNFKIC
jgi:Putative rhamnosyl transferase